jgi:hypothetical protein
VAASSSRRDCSTPARRETAPEKKTSKARSNGARSAERLTIVVRKTARKRFPVG